MTNQGKSPEFNIELWGGQKTHHSTQETSQIKQIFFGHFSNSRRLWVSSTSGFFRDPQCVTEQCVCVLWWTGDHGRVYSCLPPSHCWERLQHRHDPALELISLWAKTPQIAGEQASAAKKWSTFFWWLLKLQGAAHKQSRARATHSIQPLRLHRWRVEGISDRGIRTHSLKFISVNRCPPWGHGRIGVHQVESRTQRGGKRRH